MKKILFAVMAAALFASCSQDDMSNGGYDNESDIKVSVKDFEYDGDAAGKSVARAKGGPSRVALKYDGSALKFSWQLGDQVGVFGATDNQQVGLKMKNINSENNLSAIFESNDFRLDGGKSYMAYYPLINDVYLEPIIPVDYTGQVQTANNSTDHLGAKDYIFTPWTTAAGENNVSFTFQHISAVLWLNIKMPDNTTAYKSVTLSAADNAFTTAAKIKLADVEMALDGSRQYISPKCITEKTMNSSVTLNFNGTVKADENNMLNAWMMVLPADFTSSELTVTITPETGDPIVYTINPGKNFLSGKAYKLVVESNESDEWVDLGLPSGTLWATKNIGAEMLYDSGNYYGWGDVTGEKTVNNASSYGPQSYSGAPTSTENTYGTTYYWQCCATDSRYSQYDIAAYQLGDNWTMPTPDQVAELINNTNNMSTYINNVRGFKFVNKNDESKWIFIPAAGYKLSGNLRKNGYLYVWTSEIHWYQNRLIGGSYYDYNYNKRGLALTDYYDDGDDVTYGIFNPSYGFPVRPVIKN